MQRRFRSDMLRTAFLTFCLFFFPLFLQPSPPPQPLQLVSDWKIFPLNVYLSERYYDLAVSALAKKDVNLNKEYVRAAIYFDPVPFSPRYSAYQKARDKVLYP